MEEMNNERIAKYLAKACVGCSEGLRYAIQLFVENTVLPEDCTSYSEKEMEMYIKDWLYNMDKE